MFKHYRLSAVFTLVCLALAVWYGASTTGSLAGTASLVWIVVVLAILEVSLSFDNAVVNASVLKTMDEVWQKRFLTWGMLIAVFGMRIAFPLGIVAIAAGVSPWAAVDLSLNQPEEYERIISSAHIGIAGYGGSFLAMVGLKFFFDADKDVHWLKPVEKKLSALSLVPAASIGVLLLALYAISLSLEEGEALSFLTAGALGIVTFIGVEAINTFLQMRDDKQRLAGTAVRSGLGGFLYLNVLDASFSFDGVIGAFALSNSMVVIALGLSIGAMFVRSMTIHLVKTGTLSEYRYLEHGAFWAILALGGIMLASAKVEIPETVTGLIGAVLIGLSLWSSVKFNRAEKLSKADLPANEI